MTNLNYVTSCDTAKSILMWQTAMTYLLLLDSNNLMSVFQFSMKKSNSPETKKKTILSIRLAKMWKK